LHLGTDSPFARVCRGIPQLATVALPPKLLPANCGSKTLWAEVRSRPHRPACVPSREFHLVPDLLRARHSQD